MKPQPTLDWRQGLSDRHIAQIIRRKMCQRAKPSAKIYKRQKFKLTNQNSN